MKYKLTESAKVKYQYALMIVTTLSLFAVFVLQGLRVL